MTERPRELGDFKGVGYFEAVFQVEGLHNLISVSRMGSAQLCYTIRHRTVLIIFPLIIQTVTIAQILANGGEGTAWAWPKAEWGRGWWVGQVSS